MNTAGLAFAYAASHAFLGAAAMCDVSGAPLELLVEVVAKFTAQMPSLFEEYVAMITAHSYDSRNLRLASGVENLDSIIEFGRQAGVDTGLFEHALHSFRAAADQDVGVNLAATYEVLRRPQS